MSIPPLIDYRITWSEQGDHGAEDPMLLRAIFFQQEALYFTFYRWGSSGTAEPILTVRQLDVSMIEVVAGEA